MLLNAYTVRLVMVGSLFSCGAWAQGAPVPPVTPVPPSASTNSPPSPLPAGSGGPAVGLPPPSGTPPVAPVGTGNGTVPQGGVAAVPVSPKHWLADDQWSLEYKQARDLMMQGKFAEAASMFEKLADISQNDLRRAIALEQLRNCNGFRWNGRVLVTKSELETSGLRAKRENLRTSDEIGVLYTTALAYGLGTGVWLGSTIPENAETPDVVLPALGLGGVSIGLVALLDHTVEFHYGQAQAMATGIWLGFEEGLVWALWNQAHVERRDEWKGGTVGGVMWGFSTAGGAAGVLLGAAIPTTPGRVSYVGSTAQWSAIISGLTAAAFSTEYKTRDDNALLTAAIGLNVGAVVGVATASSLSPSISRVRFLDLTTLGGAVLFGGVALAAVDKSSDETAGRTVSGLTALGSAIGFGAGLYATKSMARDELSDKKTPHKSSQTQVTPTFSPTKNGWNLGLMGAF
jgi:hypothetical protein